MVRQGTILKLNFSPQSGHEQAGHRPALVVSNDFFNQVTNMTIVCPITNTRKNFPLHIPLDSRTETTGVVLCEHIRAVDLAARSYQIVEQIPKDILAEVISTVYSQMESPR